MNIEFYVRRDGEESARETVRMHFRNYLEGLANQRSHISTRDYRSKFVDSLLLMAEFLGDAEAERLIQAVLEGIWDRVGKAGLENPFMIPFLNYTSRVQFMGVTKVLNALKTYPLDEKMLGTVLPSKHEALKAIRVAAHDYDDAVDLLTAANIAVS